MGVEASRNWTDAGDRQLALSIFGTDEWEIVARMILEWMIVQGFGEGRQLYDHLSVDRPPAGLQHALLLNPTKSPFSGSKETLP
jgi:hypothetical protein